MIQADASADHSSEQSTYRQLYGDLFQSLIDLRNAEDAVERAQTNLIIARRKHAEAQRHYVHDWLGDFSNEHESDAVSLNQTLKDTP